jgi:Mce-associated membrane protein
MAEPVETSPEPVDEPAPMAEPVETSPEPVVEPAPVAEPTPVVEPVETISEPRAVPTALLGGLSVLALLLAAGVGFLAWDLSARNDAERARVTGRDAAAAHVAKILSYDHESFDEGTAAAEELMTERFRKEYGDTVALVREDALARESVVRAEVVAASVVSADADRVEALLFVNQTTDAGDLEEPRVDLNRVVVTLVPGETDDRWLVEDLEAL